MAEVVAKKLFWVFQKSAEVVAKAADWFSAKKAEADVVEKKKPLSIPVRYEVARVEVATILPLASVERRPFTMAVVMLPLLSIE